MNALDAPGAAPGAGGAAFAAPGGAPPAPGGFAGATGARRVPDAAQVRAILRATLRRATRGREVVGRRGKPRGLVFLLVMYGVLGLILGLLAFSRPDAFTFSLVIWSFTFTMAVMNMIAESSTLLFDPSENDILGHRPIHPRTLLLARSLGLVALALLLGLAVNLVPVFTGLAAQGARPWFPLAHLVTLLFLVLFSAAVVVFLYALLARVVSRRTFDAIASWSQVGVTVVLILCYQLVPRLMERLQGFRIDAAHPLLLLLPPTWFAALSTVLQGIDTGPRMLAMAAAAVLATPLIAWAALRYLAAGYAGQVAALSETVARPARRAGARRRATGAAPGDALLRGLMPDPVERGAFRLALAYLTRDRDMRMRLYPQLAGFLVFPLIAVVDRSMGPRFGTMLALYMAATLPTTAMMTLKMSPQYAAADLFRYAPLPGTAAIFHGVRKAILLFLVLPGLVLAAAILWFGSPDHHVLRIAVPALLALPTLSLLDGLFGDYLPLSLPPIGGRQGAINVWMMILGGVWLVIFAALAYVADRMHWFGPLLVVEVAVLAVLHPLLLRGIRTRRLRPVGG